MILMQLWLSLLLTVCAAVAVDAVWQVASDLRACRPLLRRARRLRDDLRQLRIPPEQPNRLRILAQVRGSGGGGVLVLP